MLVGVGRPGNVGKHTPFKGGGGPPYPPPAGFRWVPAVWDTRPALLKGQTGFILMPAT